MVSTQKIHAFLAHNGVASRRAAEKMVAEGRVKVNGIPAHIAQRVSDEDVVEVDGKVLNDSAAEPLYFMLYKPRGVVSTTSDELGRKTVVDFLPPNLPKLYPVGRLDLESEGLILLTNDGSFTYTFTHPKFEIVKTYHVLIAGIPSTPALMHLKRGIKLKEGFVKPVKTSILSHENGNTWLSISINEGLNQQLRRMMKRTGYEVIRLVRQSFGPLEIGTLQPGKIRELTDKELWDINGVKQMVDQNE